MPLSPPPGDVKYGDVGDGPGFLDRLVALPASPTTSSRSRRQRRGDPRHTFVVVEQEDADHGALSLIEYAPGAPPDKNAEPPARIPGQWSIGTTAIGRCT